MHNAVWALVHNGQAVKTATLINRLSLDQQVEVISAIGARAALEYHGGQEIVDRALAHYYAEGRPSRPVGRENRPFSQLVL